MSVKPITHFNHGLNALPPEQRWITKWPHHRPLCNRYAGSKFSNKYSPAAKPIVSTCQRDVTCNRCLSMLANGHLLK